MGDGDSHVHPSGRIVGRVFDDEWARTQEARQLLRAAVADGEAAKLRGAALKTAQTWAARHAEALSATEVRALLVCLEAARQEAEARHQSSAAALQRETRERSEQRTQSTSASVTIWSPRPSRRSGAGAACWRCACCSSPSHF